MLEPITDREALIRVLNEQREHKARATIDTRIFTRKLLADPNDSVSAQSLAQNEESIKTKQNIIDVIEDILKETHE